MRDTTKSHFSVVRGPSISGRWDRIMDRDAFVGIRRFIGVGTQRLVVFTLAFNLVGGLMAIPLDDRIEALQTELTALQTDEPAAFMKLKNQLLETNDQASVLLVAGIVNAPVGDISLPVTLIPGPFKPTSIQADFTFPTGITFVSATLGPVASGEGKSIQTNIINGAVRVIVFGLNQTPITDGLDFTLNVSASIKGQFPVTLLNPVASDGSGNSLPLCVTSGIVGAQ